jgi:predicted nucleic acid-binding protein
MELTVLDSGIVIAAADPADAHHGAAASALREARALGRDLVIPASAYAEALVWPARGGRGHVAQFDALLDAAGFGIAPITREIGRRSAALRRAHRTLRLPDALVIATAAELDAHELLTTDGAWKRMRNLGVRGLQVVA